MIQRTNCRIWTGPISIQLKELCPWVSKDLSRAEGSKAVSHAVHYTLVIPVLLWPKNWNKTGTRLSDSVYTCVSTRLDAACCDVGLGRVLFAGAQAKLWGPFGHQVFRKMGLASNGRRLQQAPSTMRTWWVSSWAVLQKVCGTWWYPLIVAAFSCLHWIICFLATQPTSTLKVLTFHIQRIFVAFTKGKAPSMSWPANVLNQWNTI